MVRITNREIKEKSKGITLIALVITIIVLLILAGISIATLTGENGLLTKAKTAEEQTKFTNAEEKVKLAVMASFDKNGILNENSLKNNINSIEGIREKVEEIVFDLIVEVDGYKFAITQSGRVKSEKYADILPPTATHEIIPEEGTTAGSVEIKITAQDDKSGVKSIQKPDGTIENASVATYTVTENGEYTFIIKDKEENETAYVVKITNIAQKVYLYNRGNSSLGTFSETRGKWTSSGYSNGSLIGGATGSFVDGGNYLQINLKGNVGGTSKLGAISSGMIQNPGFKKITFLYSVESCGGSPPVTFGTSGKDAINLNCSSVGEFTAEIDLTEDYTEKQIGFHLISDYSSKWATVKIHEIYLTN